MSDDTQTPLDKNNSSDRLLEDQEQIEGDRDTHIIEMAPAQKIDTESGDLATSHDGEEKLVFEQKADEIPEARAARVFLNLVSIIAGLLLGSCLVIGHFLLQIYNTKLPNFVPILFVHCVALILWLFTNLAAAVLVRERRQEHKQQAAGILTTIITAQAFLFYLNGLYSSNLFFGFLWAGLVFQLLKFFLHGVNFWNCLRLVDWLFESVTWLLIGLKIAGRAQSISWSTALTYFTLGYYFIIFLAGLLGFVLVGFFIYFICNLRSPNRPRVASLAFGAFFVLLAVAVCLAYCFSYDGVRRLLEQGAIVPFPSPVQTMPDSLFFASYLIIGLSSFGILVIFLLNLALRRLILRQIAPNMGKRILRKTYAKTFLLNLKSVGGKFFRELNAQEKTEGKGLEIQAGEQLEECLICQSSPCCFVLSPCNHCVVCQDCVSEFLQSQSKCPLCKKAIQKCAHLLIDLSKKRFAVDFAYKVSYFGEENTAA